MCTVVCCLFASSLHLTGGVLSEERMSFEFWKAALTWKRMVCKMTFPQVFLSYSCILGLPWSMPVAVPGRYRACVCCFWLFSFFSISVGRSLLYQMSPTGSSLQTCGQIKQTWFLSDPTVLKALLTLSLQSVPKRQMVKAYYFLYLTGFWIVLKLFIFSPQLQW